LAGDTAAGADRALREERVEVADVAAFALGGIGRAVLLLEALLHVVGEVLEPAVEIVAMEQDLHLADGNEVEERDVGVLARLDRVLEVGDHALGQRCRLGRGRWRWLGAAPCHERDRDQAAAFAHASP
jgi:hypothetical protein